MKRLTHLFVWFFLFSLPPLNAAFAGDTPPGPPIRVYVYFEMVAESLQDWGTGAGDSFLDFKKALVERPGWIQVAENASDADLAVQVMGRKNISLAGNGTNLVWIAIRYGDTYRTVMGSRIDPCMKCWKDASGAAAGIFIEWVKENYESIRSKEFIPGGFPEPTLTTYMDEDALKNLPAGPRLKVYFQTAETPAALREKWEKGKADAVKDLKEKVVKKATRMEITEQKEGADLVLDVIGRQYFYGSVSLWMQASRGGQQSQFIVALFSGSWKALAEQTVLRLDRWIALTQGNVAQVAHLNPQDPKMPEDFPFPSPSSEKAPPSSVPAQPPPGKVESPARVEAPPVANPSGEAPLSNQDIIDLVKAGLNEENMIASIQSAKRTAFDLSPAQIKALLSAGVSNKVISAMRSRASSTK